MPLRRRRRRVPRARRTAGLRWSELRALRVRNLQEIPYPAVRVSRAQSDGYEEKGTKSKKWRPVPLTSRAHQIARERASSWLRAGIPVHQVAKWLGHANPATTLRIYAHVLGEGQDIAAIRHLNALGPVDTESTFTAPDPNLRVALDHDEDEENAG